MEIGKLNKLDLIGNYSQRDGEEMQTIGITVIFTKSYFVCVFASRLARRGYLISDVFFSPPLG